MFQKMKDRILVVIGCMCSLALPALALNGPSGIVAPSGAHPTGGVWGVGHKYHLAFVTSTKTNVPGEHPISYWNIYVNNVAKGSPLIGVPQASWYVLGSTVEVDAKSNAVVSAPVYLLDGTSLVASSYADMWDGSLTSPIAADESASPGYGGWRSVWTGSDANGTKNSGNELDSDSTTTATGDPNGNWMNNGTETETSLNWFYALSQPLQIVSGGGDTTPPSPTNMSFATAPAGLDDETVVMTATTAYDLESTPVSYMFSNTVTHQISGWQLSPYWSNHVSARSVNGYAVKARDAVGNETHWSEEAVSSPVVYGTGYAPAPTGENPVTGEAWQIGDKYHLMFTTSTTTNAVGDHDIDYWNTYVSSVADGSSVSGISEITWYAMVSSVAVDARDNALVTVPVYLMHPVRGLLMVASNVTDMWDGPEVRIAWDESCVPVSGEIWTGSEGNGTRDVGSEIDAAGTSIRTGNATGSHWFANRERAETESKRFYALSEAIEIIYPPPPSGMVLRIK